MFKGFVLSVLKFCSAVWCPAADTHLELLDHILSDASFLTGGVVESDLALCLLYKIRCNPMHPLHAVLAVPVTHGAVIAHQNTYAPPHCRTSQYRRAFKVLFSRNCQYLYGTILVTLYSMVWDWRVSRAGPMPFYFPSRSLPFRLLLFSLSLLSFYGFVLWGWGLRLIGC